MWQTIRSSSSTCVNRIPCWSDHPMVGRSEDIPVLACGENIPVLACEELACGELGCGELACGELAKRHSKLARPDLVIRGENGELLT